MKKVLNLLRSMKFGMVLLVLIALLITRDLQFGPVSCFNGRCFGA